jgi:endonuclease/exonuclease/phosphatase family metal-dependent hydrolase
MIRILAGCVQAIFCCCVATGAELFTIATFNLENYTDSTAGNRPAKSEASRAQVRDSICAMHADVLALQEVGSTNALLELRGSLKDAGMDYPHWDYVYGADTNIFVAVFSRFPIAARRPHAEEGYLLNGRRFRLSRGIAELDIQVNVGYSFTLFVAHLKSRRPAAEADEADLREQEALVLREKVDARLRLNSSANLAVVGDLNDVKDARSTRAVLGRGKYALIDTRPSERNGDQEAGARSRSGTRTITWTHFYAKDDTYSRLDYILLSHGMAPEWDPGGSYVLAMPDWGTASDHRPVLARFFAEDR